MTRLSDKQRGVMEGLRQHGGTYYRAIGVMQPNAMLDVGGAAVPRGAVTVEALERRGLVRIDRTDYTSPAYPVRLTDAGIDAVDGVAS